MPVPTVAFAALAQFLMVVLFNISNATRFVLNFCCVAFENWLQVGIRSVFGRYSVASDLQVVVDFRDFVGSPLFSA